MLVNQSRAGGQPEGPREKSAVSARIGKLQKVPLRDIWPGEAPDFTTWLAENLDLLGEALGLRLSLLEREGDVGPFAADIVAVDEGGRGERAHLRHALREERGESSRPSAGRWSGTAWRGAGRAG